MPDDDRARQAWDRGQSVEIHGLVFGLRDGLLRRLGSSVGSVAGWAAYYAKAIDDIGDADKSFVRTSIGA